MKEYALMAVGAFVVLFLYAAFTIWYVLHEPRVKIKKKNRHYRRNTNVETF